MISRHQEEGFTLVEILIAMLIFAIVSSGVLAFFLTIKRTAEAEDISSNLTANLRIANQRIVTSIRNAGYGLPKTNQANWIPWLAGYTGGSVVITEGAGSDPDTVTLIGCTLSEITSISTATVADTAILPVNSTSGFNTASKRTLMIDDAVHAQVVFVGTDQLTIDSDPVTSGTQTLAKPYPAGTPICRVDVVSYTVDTQTLTLQRDLHDGNGYRVVVNEISDLQVATEIPGERYSITLTALSQRRNPITGMFPTTSTKIAMSLKN